MEKCPNTLALSGFITSTAAVFPLVLGALCFAGVLATEGIGFILCALAQLCATTGLTLSAVGLDRVVSREQDGMAWATAGLCVGIALCSAAAALIMRI